MTISKLLPGIIMIIGGLVYLIKPDIRKPKMGTKNFFTGQELSPTEYIRYVRILAILGIAIGILIILKDVI